MAKQTRLVKLHGKYQLVRNHWNHGRDVPWLNVSGLWLEQAGFKVGDQLEITVGSKTLKIKKKAVHGDKGD
ncbi:type I addiction module toxin, SymE family [Chitinophaga oryziterrae]|uniref:Type I addiction module toxin, SymE family n=1 Tax=Chitinophaga oryziterrae TaxID=1031224 RepID=A0A6N8JI73_9BACT|nr:SymE family type I addiction module toxin [Chitinophaga oryziterrae]MVT43842.1 type I addiction module toxin, SymE family [Chitinophaga oryziterrae]